METESTDKPGAQARTWSRKGRSKARNMCKRKPVMDPKLNQVPKVNQVRVGSEVQGIGLKNAEAKEDSERAGDSAQ